jgi:fimbrial chaperone protein
MKFKLSQFWLTLFLLLVNIQPSFAFKISPISRTFTPIGTEATQSYELTSDRDEPEAIQMSVVKREMDIDGKENYTPADDDFLIYPPQIILKPNTKQTVQVTWVGDSNPTKELNYRLVSEQVPINLTKPEVGKPTKITAKVNILLRYMGSLYVRPENVEPKLVLEGVTVQKEKDKPVIAITFDNQGSARATLTNFKLDLTSGGKTVALTTEQLKDITNQNILANHKRRFVIPYPADLPQGTLTATFDYKP